MAKQIKRTDIVEDDIFRVTRESAEETLVSISKLNEELEQSSKILSEDLKKAMTDTSKGINDFVKASEKANKLKQDASKLDEQELKIRQQLVKLAEMEEKQRLAKEKADGQAITNAQKLQKEQERQAKAMERQVKAEKDAASAYKQLEKNTRELKNQSKELAAQMLVLERNGQKNTKEYRELAKQYREVTKAAQKGDQALKQIDSTVGDNFRNVGNYSGAIDKLRNGLGALGLAFGIGEVVRGAAQTIIEFDQSVADLVSITGASGKDLQFFKEQATELGTSVEGGASAVIEAYKLIGSAKPELLSNAAALNEVTKSAITLSQASGMELPEAATALTDAMNQFGAPAEEAARYIDALANGALFGSAEIPQVTEALLKFGAVAKTSNISIEESTGLIEALAEKGLKGAEAGTALRNVMLKLSAPDALPKEAQERLEGLGISFADLQDTSKPFSERLKALKPLLNDNAALVKVFGTENAVAALNVIQNTDRIEELTSQMDTQGTASKQAQDRTNTLSFALNELKESWNQVVLGFMSGEGSTSILVKALKFVAENLGTILSYVGKAVVAWGAYKAILMAVQARQFILSGGLKDIAKNMVGAIRGTKQMAEAQDEVADKSTKAGNAMKAIPWVMLIGFAIELATKIYDVASGYAEQRRQADLLAKAEEKGAKRAEIALANEKKQLDEKLRLLDLEFRKKSAAAKSDSERDKIEKERLKRIEEITKASQKDIDVKIQSKRQELANIQEVQKRLKAAEKTYSDLKGKRDGTWDWGTTKQDAAKKQLTAVQNEYKALLKRNGVWQDAWDKQEGAQEQITENFQMQSKFSKLDEQLTKEIKDLTAGQKEFNDALDEAQVASLEAELGDYSVNVEDNTGKIKNNAKAHRELNTEMEKYDYYLSRQNELLREFAEIQTENKISAITREVDAMTEEASRLAEQGILPDYGAIELKMNERLTLEKQLIQQKLDAELEAIDKRYEEEARRAKEAIEKDYQKLISQEGLSPEERAKIEAQYQERLKLLENDETKRNADKEQEKVNAKAKSDQERVDLEMGYNDDVEDLRKDLGDKLASGLEKQNKDIEEANKEAIEKEQELAKRRGEIIQAFTDLAIEASNKRISAIDKELKAAETQADHLRELASQGNIDAKESLAEQNRLIAEAEQKKQAELKKQQRIQFANTVYQTYQKNAADESVKNPLAKTITDVTLLAEFIKTFPAFLDGTEDTGVSGQGVDGKGGFHAILHPNERVMTKEQNQRVGSLSNEALARLAEDYNTGQIINRSESASQIGGAWQTVEVLKRLEDLTNTIKSKPETNIELGEIVDGAMTIVKSSKKGNTITYNRYRVK